MPGSSDLMRREKGRMNVRRVHIIAAAIVLLAGCRIPEVQKPISESVSRRASGLRSQPKAPDTWWAFADDPALNQLVEAALTEPVVRHGHVWPRLALSQSRQKRLPCLLGLKSGISPEALPLWIESGIEPLGTVLSAMRSTSGVARYAGRSPAGCPRHTIGH